MSNDPAPPGAPNPEPPADPAGMQFDRAEPKHAASGPTCLICKNLISEVYYLVGTQKLCGSCRNGYEAERAAGSKAARVIKAGLLGFLAAVVGGSLWAYITYKSDTVWGIVAIGLGLLVGAAVRKGSEQRGGRGYQFLAMGLTYLGVAVGYSGAMIPMALKDKSLAAATEPKGAAPEAGKPAPTEEPKDAPKLDSPGALAGGCLLVIVMGIGLFLSSPILVGVSSPFSLLFLGFALWEAWKLNRALAIAGPFRLAATAPPGKFGSG